MFSGITTTFVYTYAVLTPLYRGFIRPGYAEYFIIEAILTNIICTLHFNVYKHSHVEFVYPSYWPGSMIDIAIGSDLIYINLLTL